jgi:phenylacetate-CoA ligase
MSDSFPSRTELAIWQLARLREVYQAVLPTNRFYQAKLSSVPSDLNQFFNSVPFTTKPEIVRDQQSHPPFGSNLTFPVEQYTRCHQTSGTSGQPLRWLDTRESWQWMVGNWQKILAVAGVTKTDRVFFAFSFGPFIGFWLAFEAAEKTGCICLTGGGMSTSARLRQILDLQATVLCCTPTYAIHLARTAAQEGIDLARSAVRRIMVAGEPGGSIPSTRQGIEKLWPGARVFDHHGMTEVGAVSFECPLRPTVLHIMEEAYLPEINAPQSSEQVPRGSEGELVLTTLGRAGSPLLRYRTGDIVRADEKAVCACGRSDLALVGGILGRTDDMVVVRGVNVFPSAVDEIVRSCGGVSEYRVHVNQRGALTEISVEVEPDPVTKSPDALAKKLEGAFHDALALRVPVRLAAALPRFELKAKRWVRETG